jgi:UDP-N-acetylmuramoyl-L-alanyl-D-glutamate--2,6-diaminopimelate ligase
MKLRDIFPDKDMDKALGRRTVSGISDDSRSLVRNSLFFVMPRGSFDIFSVLPRLESRVTAFVASKRHKIRLRGLIRCRPVIFVDDIGREFERVVNRFYGFRAKNLRFIGITGTNGKTTTAYLMYQILKKMGKNATLIGTLRYRIGQRSYPAPYTTPDFLTLRKMLGGASAKKGGFVVMEVSSHALDQARIRGINFSRCVFTNLSRDHLDYHHSLPGYFQAKKKLFSGNKASTAIINIDDRYGRELLPIAPRFFSYGTHRNADFRISDVCLSKKGSRFRLRYAKDDISVTIPLCGMHNVFNSTAALATLRSLGFSLSKTAQLVSGCKRIEGRLEVVYNDIFVDYAHTPEGLKKVLLTLRDIGYQKIICVFGCGGDRDRGKRRLMGAIAGRYADFTFITSDNPRSEDPLEICRQIERGFRGGNYTSIVDRREAIASALGFFFERKKAAKSLDFCLLVAGKGHEPYQIIGKKRYPLKDSRVIRELIKEHQTMEAQ